MNRRSLFVMIFAAFFVMFAPGCASKEKSEKEIWAEREEADRLREEEWRQAFEAREKAAEDEAEKRGAALDVSKELLAWSAFYKNTLDTSLDFSKLSIPERPHGSYALVVVAKGIMPDFLLAKCSLRFDTWRDPERFDILRSTRDASETYAVWLRWKRLSGHEFVAVSGEKGATLAEQLLFELRFFVENKQHHSWAFVVCPGSRSLRNDMPCIRWLDDAQEFRVFMYGAMNFLPSGPFLED